MVAALPEELVDVLQQQILLRESQIHQLSLLYNVQTPCPQVLVAHGPEETSKLPTIQHVLKTQRVEHIIVDCKECLSQRHLLSKIFARCVQHLHQEDHVDNYDRLDNINALTSNLRRLLQARQERLVIVVAGADQQRAATSTLFPALARLGDVVPCLHLIFTSSSPRPLALHKTGVPYVYFPPYKRNEAIQILLRDPPPLLPDPLPAYIQHIKEEKLHKIYNQFATVVYDTLVAPTTNSMSKYRQTCSRLWPRFIWPLLSAEKMPGKSANLDWDFTRLLGRNRILFQSEGEEALQEQLLITSNQLYTFQELIDNRARQDQIHHGSSATEGDTGSVAITGHLNSQSFDQTSTSATNDTNSRTKPTLLKYFTTLLLLSAYLASHTHHKHDIVLFSRLSTASSTNRRKKKYLARSRAGGITKTPTKSPSSQKPRIDNADNEDLATPTKKKISSKEMGMNGVETPKKERADRSMRAIFEKTSNVARPFTLERVIAILRAIHPDGIKMGKGVADRIYAELGELERLRLVVRADPKAAAKGGDAEDIMEEKWKCVVGKAWVVEAGRCWGVSIDGWEVE